MEGGEFPRVCVIGAGVAGLATARHLHEAKVPFECFDGRSRVGGIWSYTEETGTTCAWRDLNQNSPRGSYEFDDFPMPDHFADFPKREEVAEYAENYVSHFGFRENIILETTVERVEKAGAGWEVALDSGERRFL